MTCVTNRTSGQFVGGDWRRNESYTDDSGLNKFVNTEYAGMAGKVNNLDEALAKANVLIQKNTKAIAEVSERDFSWKFKEYAVWELAYWAPKITNVFVHRCTDTGVDYGEGTYAMVEFRWECCQIVGVNNVRSIVVEGETISASGTNGNVNAIVGGNYSIDNGYVLNINVTDSKGGASTYQIYLESTAFTIDFKAGGKGVAFGMPANEDGFHVDFPAHFYQAIKCYASIQSEDGTISGHSIIGDDIYSYGDITANGNLTYTQKVLWSGIWHGGWAQAAGEAIFSEPVSIQHSGIVLVFQEYNPSTQKVSGTNINSFFVSKEQIALLSGAGVNFTFAQWFGDQFVSKYLYINDTKITGNVDNATGSWTKNGVTFCNNRTVLTKVIGV